MPEFLENGDFWLLLSLLTLGVGPLLWETIARGRFARSALDGFVLVAVGGLVAIHVLPHSVAEGGPFAMLLVLLGLLGPYLLERIGGGGHHRSGHLFLTILIICGLIAHAASDGLGLIPHEGHGEHGGHALPLAIILHRIPAGFAVWFLVRSRYGTARAVGCLCLMGVATWVGYSFGLTYLPGLHSSRFALFEALIGGSLLHVLIHQPHATSDEHQPWKLAQSFGAGLGALLVYLIPWSHEHAEELTHASHTVGSSFMDLALETAPALLLGYLVAGLFAEFIPQASVTRLHKGGPFGQSLQGVMYGLPLPICSCGVVPIYKSLVTRGVPACAAMAFLVATPELGIESMLISLPLLGGKLTIVRLCCAAVVAILVGWLVGQTVPSISPSAVEQNPDRVAGGRFVRSLQVGLGEIVDETAPWILVGLGVAAGLKPAALDNWLAQIPPHLDVLLFAVLGLPIYICASGATPLAAVLLFKGVSPGAVLALLLTGPATNLTTFGVLAQLHGRWAAFKFAAGVMTFAVGLGYAVKYLLSYDASETAFAHGGHLPAWLQWGCLSILAVAFTLSLIRTGPVAFVSSLFRIGHDHNHDAESVSDGGSCCGPPAESSCCASSTDTSDVQIVDLNLK